MRGATDIALGDLLVLQPVGGQQDDAAAFSYPHRRGSPGYKPV
jgi:hypothetical protein